MNTMNKTIIIYGRPLSGKFTILSTLSREFDAKVTSLNLPTSNEPSTFPDHKAQTFHMMSKGTTINFITISGGVFGDYVWHQVLETANGVILVIDSSPASHDDATRALDFLQSVQAMPDIGCVMVSKCDLIDDNISTGLISQISQIPEISAWPVFHTRSDMPETIVAASEWLVGKIL